MNNILLRGGPGTGKTVLSRAIAYYVGAHNENIDNVYGKDIYADADLIESYIQSDKVEYIQVHGSMTYEDIVYGMDISVNGTMNMSFAEKRIMQICNRAINDPNHTYFIILDDIERANASHLLGNMIYAMEYRNEPVGLYDGNTLIIPDNIKIIITECRGLYGYQLDYALRRRFDYEKELNPDVNIIDKFYNGHLSNPTRNIVLNIFETIRNFVFTHLMDDFVSGGDRYVPGHGMYMVNLSGRETDILLRIKQKFDYQVFPCIEDMARSGIINPSDAQLDDLYNTIHNQLNVGTAIAPTTSQVQKIFHQRQTAVPAFGLEDSKNYYTNTILPSNCREHRAIIENIIDAILLNGVFSVDKAMADILLNSNVVRFENRSRPGVYAAYLVEAARNMDYGYLTTVSTNIRSYYSSNSCRTGRWETYRDAPAYNITYSDGRTVEYIALNAFRNAGFDVNSPVIHAQENTASIYCALFRLVKAYLDLYERELSILAAGDSSYIDTLQLVQLEKEYWRMVQRDAAGRQGNDQKLIRLAAAVLNLRTLWNAAGTLIDVDEAKFNALVAGNTQISIINYEGIYNITGVTKSIELKGVPMMVNLNDYQAIMENIGVHQMIFQGPPGTSKTFESKKFVLKQLKPTSSVFSSETQVTQSLISAELDQYKLTESDYQDPTASAKLSTGGWDIVQFHPSYGYEDFIRGIEVRPVGGAPTYTPINRILGKIAEFAKIAENKANQQSTNIPKFYLVIDEINRANLATVFGELIYGLEYRNSKVSTPYEVEDRTVLTSGCTTKDIILGKNLFIVGTMNTADRSIDSIDYAIRRRFVFIDSPANRDVVLTCYQSAMGVTDENSIELLLFDAVGYLFEGDRFFNEEYQRNDVRIGHTYFLRSNAANYSDEIIERFVFQVVPILREYLKDGIIDSDEDLKTMEHPAAEINAVSGNDRVRMVAENIMLYIKCFGEKNAAGIDVDNAYIAGAIENMRVALGF